MSEPIQLISHDIYTYTMAVNGAEVVRQGTGELVLRCGEVDLYLWNIRPRKTWWGTTCNSEDAVIVTPCAAMMTNVEKYYKYEFCMDIHQGFDLLVAMGVPTREYSKMAKELGWHDFVAIVKDR